MMSKYFFLTLFYFSVCEGEDFENLSLLKKFEIFFWPYAPSSLDLYGWVATLLFHLRYSLSRFAYSCNRGGVLWGIRARNLKLDFLWDLRQKIFCGCEFWEKCCKIFLWLYFLCLFGVLRQRLFLWDLRQKFFCGCEF